MGGTAVFAAAKETDEAAAEPKREAKQARSPQAVLEHYKRTLELTEEQAAKLEPILVARVEAQKVLVSEAKELAPEVRKTKMEAFNKEWNAKVRAVLNSNQKMQFDMLTAVREAGRGKQPDLLAEEAEKGKEKAVGE